MSEKLPQSLEKKIKKETTYPYYFTVNGKRFVTDGTRGGCRRVYDDPPPDPNVIDAEFTIIEEAE